MLAEPSIPESTARLLADHIDRAGGRAAAIAVPAGPLMTSTCWVLKVSRVTLPMSRNAVHIDAVRGIHAAHKDGIPGG